MSDNNVGESGFGGRRGRRRRNDDDDDSPMSALPGGAVHGYALPVAQSTASRVALSKRLLYDALLVQAEELVNKNSHIIVSVTFMVYGTPLDDADADAQASNGGDARLLSYAEASNSGDVQLLSYASMFRVPLQFSGEHRVTRSITQSELVRNHFKCDDTHKIEAQVELTAAPVGSMARGFGSLSSHCEQSSIGNRKVMVVCFDGDASSGSGGCAMPISLHTDDITGSVTSFSLCFEAEKHAEMLYQLRTIATANAMQTLQMMTAHEQSGVGSAFE